MQFILKKCYQSYKLTGDDDFNIDVVLIYDGDDDDDDDDDDDHFSDCFIFDYVCDNIDVDDDDGGDDNAGDGE